MAGENRSDNERETDVNGARADARAGTLHSTTGGYL
jgi:hypothetical protein